MSTVLMLGAFLSGVVGFALLSQATMGVGVICLGCLMGILARILQADAHHNTVMTAMAATAPETIRAELPATRSAG